MITITSVFEKWDLEDKSVQAIITSPPFWSLRKYDIPDVIIGNNNCEHEFSATIPPRGKSNWDSFKDYKYSPGGCKGGTKDNYNINHGNFCLHCNAWKGQYGLEPTYQQYIEHTRIWAKEAWRVLRDDGVFFLNIADSYGGSCQGWGKYGTTRGKNSIDSRPINIIPSGPDKPPSASARPKCQCLIPERISIMLVDELGFIRRNFIVWYKENAMPESVKDRFTKKWEPVFFFTKSPKYYFDLDAVREPYKEVSKERLLRAVSDSNKYLLAGDPKITQGLNKPRPNVRAKFNIRVRDCKTGRIKSPIHKASQKEIDNYNLKELSIYDETYRGKNPGDVWIINTQPSPFKHYAMFPEKLVERMILCSTKKGDTVLDCFAGSATTLAVAERLNRKGIGFDLGYQDIQKVRLTEIQKELL